MAMDHEMAALATAHRDTFGSALATAVTGELQLLRDSAEYPTEELQAVLERAKPDGMKRNTDALSSVSVDRSTADFKPLRQPSSWR